MNPPPPPPPVPPESAAVQAAEEIAFVEKIDSVLSCGNPQSAFAYSKVAEMIRARFAAMHAIDPLRAELEALKSENKTFRAAQKACVDCDAPTLAETEKAESALTAERAKVRELVEALEAIRREHRGYVVAEQLSGNAVKEAQYQGICAGLQIAVAELLARHSAAPPTGTGLKEGEIS